MKDKFARLTHTQARARRNRIRPMLSFMRRFLARLDQRGFNPQGELCEAVLSAYKTLDRVHMHFVTEHVVTTLGDHLLRTDPPGFLAADLRPGGHYTIIVGARP
jgi:hypothetical protein